MKWRKQSMDRLWHCGVILLTVCSLNACGGPSIWVKEGSGAFNNDGTKELYGVGSVVGVRNEPFA